MECISVLQGHTVSYAESVFSQSMYKGACFIGYCVVCAVLW